jgi:site-specific DNA-methyltransferase (adenine-specific)
MTIDLRLGDCLEILPTLEDKSVDAIITDLPYGTTSCSWDVVIPFEPMWKQVKRVLKPSGAFVTTSSQPFTSVLIMSNIKWFRYCWVWDKNRATGGANADKAPMKAHEDIAVFGKVSPFYVPQMGSWAGRVLTRRKSAFTKADGGLSHGDHISPGKDEKLKRGRFPDSVVRIPALGSQDPERVGHPTQKPVALYEYLIKTYTNPGGTVLDFCMGVGTTGVACEKTGRGFIGTEVDSKYFELAQKRIRETTRQLCLENT